MSEKPSITKEQQQLLDAINYGNFHSVEALVENVDLHFSGTHGSPLALAAMGNNQSIINMLLSQTNWTQEERAQAVAAAERHAFEQELNLDSFTEAFNLILGQQMQPTHTGTSTFAAASSM